MVEKVALWGACMRREEGRAGLARSMQPEIYDEVGTGELSLIVIC